jgi:hypothetical protein
VPGASHFWKGAGDVAAIIARSVEFLREPSLFEPLSTRSSRQACPFQGEWVVVSRLNAPGDGDG